MSTLELTWRDGRTAAVEDPAGTVVEAAEAAGLSLPYGCRTGACGSCTGRLVWGHLNHERPPRALKQRHLNDGYVLTCIATPDGDCAVEVGVQRNLLRNPLK